MQLTPLALAATLAALTVSHGAEAETDQIATARAQADKVERAEAKSDEKDAKAEAKAEAQAQKAETKASTSKESPVQSGARPYNLDIVAPVQLAGSDAASADFQKNVLPAFTEIMNESLSESKAVENLSAVSLDPSKLVLKNDANVRVYFVGEGAGYRNSLGFSTSGEGIKGADAALIFPDASTMGDERVGWAPLAAGDFVDLGQLKAGSLLDFFLIADGALGGTEVYSARQSQNRDGMIHTVSLAPDGSAFLLIGFEDLYGSGDSDFNDVVFAVEIGKANVASLAAPEPSLALGGAFASLAFFGSYRRRRA